MPIAMPHTLRIDETWHHARTEPMSERPLPDTSGCPCDDCYRRQACAKNGTECAEHKSWVCTPAKAARNRRHYVGGAKRG